MAVSIFDENTPHEGSEYFPFDDSRHSSIQKAVRDTSLATENGIGTQEIDEFRQGIEITTQKYRSLGTGNKFWAGNILGYTKVTTYGQALSFTEYENDKKFYELPRFDPVYYIEAGLAYPRPIVFNEGPQQNEEASVEPLTIPFRKGLNTNEGPEHAHAFRGSVEDGNNVFDRLNGFTNRIEQRIEYKVQDEPWPFLDEGQEYIGNHVTSSIIVDGYFDFVERTIEPFDDLSDKILQKRLNTGNITSLISASSELSLNLDLDIRGGREYRSAAAGWDAYGPARGRYGTDSLTFLGLVRGS